MDKNNRRKKAEDFLENLQLTTDISNRFLEEVTPQVFQIFEEFESETLKKLLATTLDITSCQVECDSSTKNSLNMLERLSLTPVTNIRKLYAVTKKQPSYPAWQMATAAEA